MASERKSISRKTGIGILLLLAVMTLIVFNGVSMRIFQSVELDKGRTKLSLYQTIVDNELLRLQHLPKLMAQDTDIAQPDRLNAKLKSLANSSKAEAIYALDEYGMTFAASNYDQEQTFLGRNYQFRPYFIDAMNGRESSFFAIGATTSRPGYFLAAPIETSQGPFGAFVVKVDLTALTSALEGTDDKIVVTNRDGVVVLSSVREFRYRTTAPIQDARMAEIQKDRQFGKQSLDPLAWDKGERTINVEGENYLLLSGQLTAKDWHLFYLADANVAKTRALTVSLIAGAIMISLASLSFIWRERRVRDALITSQKDRRRMQREIEVRRKAEQRLENAQSALKRSSKLAALGQLSASVTHELGQPISAMKNHIAAEMIVTKKPPAVFTNLSGIVDRMDNITKQLKFFSTDGDDFEDTVNLLEIVTRAVDLMQYDFKQDKVKVTFTDRPQDFVSGGSAQRLEQVVINILRNSLRAMQETKDKHITIGAQIVDGFNVLSFQDNGHGLMGQNLEQITEPFHTTGPSGEGMGLGLAISSSIIEEHAGTMNVRDLDGQGVIFEIKLPNVSEQA